MPAAAIGRGIDLRALAVLALLTLVNALAQSGATLLSAVLPLIKTEFGFSDSQLGLLTGYGSVLTFAVLTLPIAQWAARFGRSQVLAACMVVCGIANALTAGCHSFWQLIAARLTAAAGPAAAWPLGQALVSDLYSYRNMKDILIMFRKYKNNKNNKYNKTYTYSYE
jgi:predicted MFS family arabinose efflux permease